MTVFRARPSRSARVLFAVRAGICVAVVASRPGYVVWLVVTFVLVGMMVGVAMLATRLEITEGVVRARQGRATKQVARSEICSLHYYPGVISSRGPDRKPIMKIAPDYTLRQMLDVADVLAVPLYAHRRWLGLRKVRIGRLVNPRGRSQPVR